MHGKGDISLIILKIRMCSNTSFTPVPEKKDVSSVVSHNDNR